MEDWDPWGEDFVVEDKFLIWLRKNYPNEDGWKFIRKLDFGKEEFKLSEMTKYLPRLEMIMYHSSI